MKSCPAFPIVDQVSRHELALRDRFDLECPAAGDSPAPKIDRLVGDPQFHGEAFNAAEMIDHAVVGRFSSLSNAHVAKDR